MKSFIVSVTIKMLVYYTGYDKEGEKFRRFDEVLDVEDIYDALDKNDEELVQLIELPAAASGLSKVSNRKLKNKEVVEFCHHLSTYIDGGIDLASIFGEIELESKNGKMQKLIKKIATNLEQGDSLSEAFKQTKSLPDILIILVEMGERSGNVSRALRDAAIYLERDIDLRSSTFRALIYPVFTLSVMMVGFFVWIAFVIPQVVTLVQSMDVELPVQTEILMIVSQFMQDYWVLELVLFVGIIVGFFVARQFDKARFLLDKLWWKFPITGKVIASSQMAFYFSYFKVLYDAGIPVSDILENLQESVSNKYFKQKIKNCNDLIREGGTLQSSYEKVKVYEVIAIRIIGVGEQTGNITKQLGLLGEIYHKRVKVFVETLPKILEPIFITIIAILFILFASTLLGPLYEVILRLGAQI